MVLSILSLPSSLALPCTIGLLDSEHSIHQYHHNQYLIRFRQSLHYCMSCTKLKQYRMALSLEVYWQVGMAAHVLMGSPVSEVI